MKTTKRQIADTMTVVNAGTPGNRNATRYAYKSENYVYQGTTGQPVHRIQFDGQCVELDDYCTRERFIDAVYEDLNG